MAITASQLIATAKKLEGYKASAYCLVRGDYLLLV